MARSTRRPSLLALAGCALLVAVCAGMAPADERTPKAWVADLASEDPETRSAARKRIGELGPGAVPALLERLTEAEDPSPCLALLFGWDMAPFASHAVAVFTRLLQTPGETPEANQVRFHALLTLGRFGPGAPYASLPIQRVLREDPSPSNRVEAARILLERGMAAARVLPDVEPLLSHDGAFLRMGLVEVLRLAAVEEERAVAGLVRMAQGDPDVSIEWLCAALAELGTRAAPAHERLAVLLASPDRTARLHAAAALLRLGAYVDRARPVLLEAARSRSFDDRKVLAHALRMGLAGDAVGAFVPVLEAAEVDRAHAFMVWWGLARAGADAAPALPVLRRWLRDEDALAFGLEALAHLGPAAAAARDDLTSLLAMEDPEVRVAAALPLLRLAPSDVKVRKAFTDAWGALPARGRGRMARALGAAAADCDVVVPALVQLVGHDDHEVRARAASGVARAGPSADVPVPILLAGLQDRYPTVREACACALAALRPDGPRTDAERRLLREATRNDQATVRLWMRVVLARGPRAEALPAMDQAALKVAAAMRPGWRKPTDLGWTWEPALAAELARAARSVLAD